jgi:hypothetical protein
MTLNASNRVLSITPPMTHLKTPYPSTARLMGFLRSRCVQAVHAVQVDLTSDTHRIAQALSL